MNNFDQYGWYTSEDNGRQATVGPPDLSETTTPGEPRANWTGRRWVVVPYTTAPPEPVTPGPEVPVSITPMQAELVLIEHDLLDAVAGYISGIPGKEGKKAQAQFNRAQEWRRDWPLLNAIAQGLGLTSEQLDQMFIEGAKL